MARSTDVRVRMIQAGQELLSSRGYSVTMLDVIERADAPRGSIYYHFPNGKEELAIAAIESTGDDIQRVVAHFADRNAEPAAFVQALVNHHAKRLAASGFAEGCPVLGITVSADSPVLADVVNRVFGKWVSAVAGALRDKGIAKATSEQLATTIVASIEGGIVLARANKDRKPLDQVRIMLATLVRASLK